MDEKLIIYFTWPYYTRSICTFHSRTSFNPTEVLRFSFDANEYEIPEGGDRNTAVDLEHNWLSQPVEVTVTLMTLEEAQTDPYDLTAFFEDVTFEGTNATSESIIVHTLG